MDTYQLFEEVKKYTLPKPANGPASFQEAAVELLSHALNEEPDNFLIRNKLAYVFYANKKYKEADALLPEDDPNWSAQRLRLDIYRCWLQEEDSAAIWEKFDALMHRFASATFSPESSGETLGNFSKFKRAIGQYIAAGRFIQSLDFVGQLAISQPELGKRLRALKGLINVFAANAKKKNGPAPKSAASLQKDTKSSQTPSLVDAFYETVNTLRQSKTIIGAGLVDTKDHSLSEEDAQLYKAALTHFINGDSSKALKSLEPIFAKNIFDPLAAIICIASSSTSSDLRYSLKEAFGLKTYQKLNEVTQILLKVRITPPQNTRIKSSPVLTKETYTIDSAVDRLAKRVVKKSHTPL